MSIGLEKRACVEKLARPNPKLISTTPGRVIYRVEDTRSINGLIITLPAQVKPAPNVPTNAIAAVFVVSEGGSILPSPELYARWKTP